MMKPISHATAGTVTEAPARPRVLISTSTFPLRPNDGLPRFVCDLAEAMSAYADVTTLAPDAPGAMRRERIGPVDVRRFTYFRPRSRQSLAYGDGMPDNLRASFLCKLQPLPFILAQTSAIRRLVRAKTIDVVHSHWLIPQGLSAALARGRRPRFRHVLTVHGSDVHLLRRMPFGRALARFVLGRTDAVFAVGSHIRDTLDTLLGRPAGAILQPNGVWVDRFRPSHGAATVESPFRDGYLLFFGRLIEVKGVSFLLKAMPKILDRHPGLGLMVVGGGPLERALRREADTIGVGRSVRFLGRQPYTEVIRYARGARVAVVPSIIDRYGKTEGMPTVVLEAMAAGTRVVGSAVDGIPDIIRHGENGWLCRDKNPSALASTILTALDDPATSDVVQQTLETAARFDWSCVAARYADVFHRLLSGGGEHNPATPSSRCRVINERSSEAASLLPPCAGPTRRTSPSKS